MARVTNIWERRSSVLPGAKVQSKALKVLWSASYSMRLRDSKLRPSSWKRAKQGKRGTASRHVKNCPTSAFWDKTLWRTNSWRIMWAPRDKNDWVDLNGSSKRRGWAKSTSNTNLEIVDRGSKMGPTSDFGNRLARKHSQIRYHPKMDHLILSCKSYHIK